MQPHVGVAPPPNATPAPLTSPSPLSSLRFWSTEAALTALQQVGGERWGLWGERTAVYFWDGARGCAGRSKAVHKKSRSKMRSGAAPTASAVQPRRGVMLYTTYPPTFSAPAPQHQPRHQGGHQGQDDELACHGRDLGWRG